MENMDLIWWKRERYTFGVKGKASLLVETCYVCIYDTASVITFSVIFLLGTYSPSTISIILPYNRCHLRTHWEDPDYFIGCKLNNVLTMN